MCYQIICMFQKKKITAYDSKPLIHRFGYQYSQSQQRPTFFSQTIIKEIDPPEELLQTYQAYTQKLQKRLSAIKGILVKLLEQDGQNSIAGVDRSIEDLLEQLLLMILAKEEENHQLKRHNMVLRAEIHSYLNSQESLCSSQEIQDSRVAVDMSELRPSDKEIHYFQLHNIKGHQQNLQLYRNSEESTKTRSLYKPRMLFSLGKEVKTINEMNSELIISDTNAYSKNNSRQPSFKELMKLKQNQHRMSIDRSLPQQGQAFLRDVNVGQAPEGRAEEDATTQKRLSVKIQRLSKKYQENNLMVDKQPVYKQNQTSTLYS